MQHIQTYVRCLGRFAPDGLILSGVAGPHSLEIASQVWGQDTLFCLCKPRKRSFNVVVANGSNTLYHIVNTVLPVLAF